MGVEKGRWERREVEEEDEDDVTVDAETAVGAGELNVKTLDARNELDGWVDGVDVLTDDVTVDGGGNCSIAKVSRRLFNRLLRRSLVSPSHPFDCGIGNKLADVDNVDANAATDAVDAADGLDPAVLDMATSDICAARSSPLRNRL